MSVFGGKNTSEDSEFWILVIQTLFTNLILRFSSVAPVPKPDRPPPPKSILRSLSQPASVATRVGQQDEASGPVLRRRLSSEGSNCSTHSLKRLSSPRGSRGKSEGRLHGCACQEGVELTRAGRSLSWCLPSSGVVGILAKELANQYGG